MKLDRLLSIVVLLLNRERICARDLSARFEVTVRTIYRDLEAINAAGVPIIAMSGPGGGYGIDPSYTIDRRLLDFDDLCATIAALKGVNSAVEDRRLGSALEKIASLAPKGRAREMSEDRIVIDLFPWGRRDDERRLFKRIEPAIAERRLLQFRYASYGRKGEVRLVEPMTLVFRAYAWYLWGYCRARSDYRLFKLSRMSGLEARAERFVRRPEAYRREEPALDLPETELLLRCDREHRDAAEEWFGGRNIECADDGGLLIRLSVPAGDWIVKAILGFGGGLSIVEPEALRVRLASLAARIAAENGDGGSPRPPATKKKARSANS